MTRLGLRVADFVRANPGLTLEEIARGVHARTAAVRKVLMSDGFSWSLRLLHPSDRAKVYRVVSVERDGRGTADSGPSEAALEAAVLAAGQLAAEGKTIDEIREQLGVSLRTAWRYLASAEVRPAPRPRDYDTENWERSVRLVMARTARMTRFGYVAIYLPMHPNSTVRGEVLEHRLVMERQLGRFLLPEELVHHINEVRTDNRAENLQIVSIAEHQRIHADRQLGPTLVRADSQNGKVLAALRELGGVGTASEIHRLVGPMRLNSRVAELRRRGYDIPCRHLAGVGKGPNAYEYRLVSEPPVGTSDGDEARVAGLPALANRHTDGTVASSPSDASTIALQESPGASDSDRQLSLSEAA